MEFLEGTCMWCPRFPSDLYTATFLRLSKLVSFRWSTRSSRSAIPRACWQTKQSQSWLKVVRMVRRCKMQLVLTACRVYRANGRALQLRSI